MTDKTDSKEREALRSIGEEQAFEAWFKVDCPVEGANAKIAAKAAWKARASLAANSGSEPVATDMVAVCREDANRYCIILRLLGMEEEGDPVAEIQRLQDLAANLQGKPHGWLYDWTHSSATGRPDESFTGFTEDENHARSGTGNRNIRAVYTIPSPSEGMVGGWMPIETAPKDGARILLHPAVEVHDAWSKGHWSEQQGCWMVGGSASGVAHTYWLPLPPAPPTTSAGSGMGE